MHTLEVIDRYFKEAFSNVDFCHFSIFRYFKMGLLEKSSFLHLCEFITSDVFGTGDKCFKFRDNDLSAIYVDAYINCCQNTDNDFTHWNLSAKNYLI